MKIFKVLLICSIVLFAGIAYSQTVTQTAHDNISTTTCPFEKVAGLSKSNQSGKSGYVFLLQFVLGIDQEVYPERYMTGYFGDLTTKALKRYQSKNGISATGVVDSETIVKLCEEYTSQGCIFNSDDMFLMAKGATSPKYYIYTLQSLLDYLGYYSGEPNGSFGATTEEALVKFQTAAKLYPTKIIDADTRTALCAVWNKLIDYSKSFGSSTTTVTTKKPTTYAPSNYISSPLSAYCFAFPNKANVNTPVYFYALAVGGKYPYAYNWGGSVSGSNSFVSQVFSAPGAYTGQVAIKDAYNNIKMASCSTEVGGSSYVAPVNPSTTTTTLPSSYVHLKVDGHQIYSGIYKVPKGGNVNISWETKGVYGSCFSESSPLAEGWGNGLTLDKTGSRTVSNITENTMIGINCNSNYGLINDWIKIEIY